MMEFDVKKLVFSSSATVYGQPQYLPVDENHPTGRVHNIRDVFKCRRCSYKKLFRRELHQPIRENQVLHGGDYEGRCGSKSRLGMPAAQVTEMFTLGGFTRLSRVNLAKFKMNFRF
jgi:hypothetical protein